MKCKSLYQALVLTMVVGTSFCSHSADFETGASATVASQYLFRGFDLNQEDPTIQGDLTVEHKSGFSGGIWASTYDFGGDDGVELDLFASYAFSISDTVSLSVGFTEYTFSGDSDASTEFSIGVSLGDFGVTFYDDVDLDISYVANSGLLKMVV